MRMALCLQNHGTALDEAVERIRAAAGSGYSTVWMGETGGWDPLTLLAVAGREVDGVALGTAVVRTLPRHPLALAAQALTAQAATGGRLILGIGPSHRPLIEDAYGLSYAAPARNLREYLTALRPLLRGEEASQHGEHWTVAGRVDTPGTPAPPVLISALGPRMLRLAGELADGTLTVWAGPATIGGVIAPELHRAAEAAGRPGPEVVAAVPVCVTADPDGVREWTSARFGGIREKASYRALLDQEGASSAGDTVVAGDEEQVARELRRFADAGATEVQAITVGTAEDQARTEELLPRLAP
ncbi:TIGR03564 family F420-dependent LLM class oxidoreductase [Nocardiopsis sediminis]|uniref:TIGR03564 family F420-dependent LLM class oxidoreductase n=1 Tax=Nocardiopsis sediminis TaxID=1778267 RepID=A0ABV8FHN1_9ACTN